MGLVRKAAIPIGLLSLGAAVALLVAPERLADSGVGAALEGTPADTVAKLGLALVFGTLSLVSGLSRAEAGERSLPTPETVGAERATTGAEIDRQLAIVAEDGDRGQHARARIRREVRSVAVDTLVDVEDVSEETAERRLETGDWTADPRAAAFLGGDGAPRPSLSIRLRDWLSADPTFTRRARAAVADLERRRERP